MNICNICSVELTLQNKVVKRKRCKVCHSNVLKENSIKWNAKNPDKLKEYQKKHLIKRQVETTCDCGCRFQVRELERHLESKKHINFKNTQAQN